MPSFTAWIDRDHDRKVIVNAATAAHAREYATARYGKVVKLKAGSPCPAPTITKVALAALRNHNDGIGIYRGKWRRLHVLGLIDDGGGITDVGRRALLNLAKDEGGVTDA